MKIEVSELFEHKEVEYQYTAVIYEGDEAYTYPDAIRDLERDDGAPIGEDIWDEVEIAAMNHAYETLRKSRGLNGNEALRYKWIKDKPDGWIINVDEKHSEAFCNLIEKCGNVIHSVKHIGFNNTADIEYGPIAKADDS